jgi:4-carboxymuconolactone decarboxylase
VTSARYELGKATLSRMNPHVDRVLASVRDTHPDMERLLVEFGYGDIVSRPGLGSRERELATIAALVAMPNAQGQLFGHLEGALNVGCTPNEIAEVILHMVVYAGFPAALNAMAAAKQVFDKRGVTIVPEAKKGDALAVAERQLEAYNKQDLDAYCACFATDCVVGTLNGAVTEKSREEIRTRYAKAFAQYPGNRARLVNRMVVGNTVIDHEDVSRGLGLEQFEIIAIYTIKDGLIARVDFAR